MPHDWGMYRIEVTDPEGKPLHWEKTVGLNIGIGVAPEMHAVAYMGERDDDYLPAVHLRLYFNFGQGRYIPTFVGYEGPDVDGTDLRSVRVNELVQLVSSHGVFVKFEKDAPPGSLAHAFGGEGMPSFTHGDMAAKVKSTGPEGWVLRYVVLTYQLAQIASQAPVKAVQKAFGLTERTAARWIAKAKENGLMVRPSVPGWEGSVDDMDSLRERISRGEPLVREVTEDDLRSWGVIDGEHQAEG